MAAAAHPSRARRIAVGIEYDGRDFSGWQAQATVRNVQRVLEERLSQVADEAVLLTSAGRTDAGVHARAQVAHFDTQARRRPRAWVLGANARLPRDVSLRWALEVPAHFHARYSALARSYRYVILNRTARSALAGGRALLVHRPLDVSLMNEAGAALIGEHDFSAFRSSECQARSPIRELRSVCVERSGDWVTIEVTANAFLHHMVRNIAGLLLAIGARRLAPERARVQLESRARSGGASTAAAHGLYLWRVDYPPQFGLPADSAIIESPLSQPT